MRKLLMQSGNAGQTFKEFYPRQGLPLLHVPSDASPSIGFTNEGGGYGSQMKLSPDANNFIGMNYRNNSYVVWRSSVDAPFATQQAGIVFAGQLKDVAISNTHFALCGTSPFLYLYALSDMFPVQIDASGLGECTAVEFSPDGSKLAVAHKNGTHLRLYDLGNGSYTDAPTWNSIERPQDCPIRLAFIDNGSRIASVSNRYQPLIHIYQTNTLEEYVEADRGYLFNVTGDALFKQNPCRPSDVVYARIERANTVIDATLVAYNCETFEATPIVPYNFGSLPFGAATTVTATNFCFSRFEREIYVMLANSDALFIAVYDADTYAFKRWESINKEGGNITGYLLNQQWQVMLMLEDGAYQITGTVRDINNAPCARTVRAFRRSDGVCMAQTESDATTGDYRLLLPDAGPYDVQFQALPGENLNDLFFARSEPEPIGA